VDPLVPYIASELAGSLDPAIRIMADRCRQRFGDAALAVLFYGSCLRQPDQPASQALMDFYVLVDDYAGAYRAWLPALANRLLPPNVFYLENNWQGRTYRAKYAVMSLDQFHAGCLPGARNISIWARFSQPARLVWSRDASIAGRVAVALAQACRTMLASVSPLLPPGADGLDVWLRALKETYGAELRSERIGRAEAILAAAPHRYRQIGAMILAEPAPAPVSPGKILAEWRSRRLRGKIVNLLRLIKAAFTFEGGVEYVLWKVQRHSGVSIPVSEWQKRHPILSAPILAWKLYRRGAFR
jgi:hypothetical protein